MQKRVIATAGDVGLITIALALALGWAIFQTAEGVAYFVEGIVSNQPATLRGPFGGGSLTWTVGHRVLTFDQLVIGLVEVATVVGLAVVARRRLHNSQSEGD